MSAAPRRVGWVRPVGLAAAVVVAAVLVAWVLQARYAGGAGSSKDAPAPPYSIAVMKDGKTLKNYDLAALHALPQSTVTIDGKTQDGPSLTALLHDAGVTSYSAVDVKGAGLRDRGSLTLDPAQVRQHVQLDFSDRGTVKVCGPELYHAEWVRDVVSIDAR